MAPIRRRRTTSTTTITNATPITRSHTLQNVDWHPEPPSTDEPPPPAWYPTLDLFTLYHLRQISPSTQTLVPAQRLSSLPSYARTASSTEPTVQPDNSDCPLPSYTVKSNSSGGLLNRKPDIILTRHDPDRTSPNHHHHQRKPLDSKTTTIIAEGRFDRVSSRTFLSYPRHTPKCTAEMDVESSLTQKHLLFLGERVCTWQPTDPDSKRCLELRCSEDGLMACWTYANEPNRWGYGREDAAGEIGVLQVSQRLFGGAGEREEEDLGRLDDREDREGRREERERLLEQVLCSAVVLVERIKRRSASLGSVGKGQVGHGLGQM